jgi:hypothetical protein
VLRQTLRIRAASDAAADAAGAVAADAVAAGVVYVAAYSRRPTCRRFDLMQGPQISSDVC